MGGIKYSTRQIVTAFAPNSNRYLLNLFLSGCFFALAAVFLPKLEIPTETVVY
jgi:hypothetical protein